MMNTSPHFALLSLPVQIRADIASRLDLPSLSALARTSKNAVYARHPLLYVRIKAQFGCEAALFIPDEAMARLDRLLEKRAPLKNRRSLRIAPVVKRRATKICTIKLLELPDVLLRNMASQLDLGSYVAWMVSCQRAKSLFRPLLKTARRSGPGRNVVWPELDQDSVRRMNLLGLESRLVTMLRKTPAKQLIKAGRPERRGEKSRLEQHLENLPALPALRVVTRFFESLRMAMGSAACKEVLIDVLGNARQAAALHNYWSETVDLVTHLLSAVAQSLRQLDAQSKFTVTERVLTRMLMANLEKFLAALVESGAQIDKPRLHDLVGEMLRTHIQGYSRGWEAAHVWKIWKANPVLTQLVSDTELEYIFGLARSHAHQSISYRDIRQAKEKLAVANRNIANEEPRLEVVTRNERNTPDKTDDISGKRYENCVLS